jgi:hypothetical protein
VAFVRPADGTALRARCLEQLARFKVPERIVVVEAFPIVDSPNGPKVQRVRLREMAELLLREQGDHLTRCPYRIVAKLAVKVRLFRSMPLASLETRPSGGDDE